jgi:hypothetical protein
MAAPRAPLAVINAFAWPVVSQLKAMATIAPPAVAIARPMNVSTAERFSPVVTCRGVLCPHPIQPITASHVPRVARMGR